MPAPVSSSLAACSSTVARSPARASAMAAVSPAIPAPATMTSRAATGSGGGGRRQRAFGRARRVRVELGVEAVERRAIGADRLAFVAHVDKDVRVVVRRRGADAHEFLGADRKSTRL